MRLVYVATLTLAAVSSVSGVNFGFSSLFGGTPSPLSPFTTAYGEALSANSVLHNEVAKLTSSVKDSVKIELERNADFTEATLFLWGLPRDFGTFADDATLIIRSGRHITDEHFGRIFQKFNEVLLKLSAMNQALPAFADGLIAKAESAFWPAYLHWSSVAAFESAVRDAVSGQRYYKAVHGDQSQAEAELASHVVEALGTLLNEGPRQPRRHGQQSTTPGTSETSALSKALNDFINTFAKLSGALQEELHRISQEFTDRRPKDAVKSLNALATESMQLRTELWPMP